MTPQGSPRPDTPLTSPEAGLSPTARRAGSPGSKASQAGIAEVAAMMEVPRSSAADLPGYGETSGVPSAYQRGDQAL